MGTKIRESNKIIYLSLNEFFKVVEFFNYLKKLLLEGKLKNYKK